MSTFYVVSTPIGNLEDITFRALRILKEVDLIVCEDTRQTLKLLNHYNIKKPTISYHQHSKLQKIDYILSLLKQGKPSTRAKLGAGLVPHRNEVSGAGNLALVTDAGTPGISDPGGILVQKLTIEQAGKIKIVPIPGPNAVTAALSVSGFPADRFVFMGFPPHKKGRNKFFTEVAEAKYTVIFYESTHRILKTLNQLKEILRERKIVVCRELTKQFESIYRGNAEEILKILESDKNNLKGEFVVIVN